MGWLMALIGNGYRDTANPMNWLGGPSTFAQDAAHRRVDGNQKNWYIGQATVIAGISIANKSGRPEGTRHPHAWVMPPKAGGMAARRTITGSSDITSANLAAGINLGAGLTGSGDITNALLGLIVSMQANLTGSGTVSTADFVGVGNLTSALSGSGDVTAATMTGIGHMVAALTGTNTLTATIFATGSMSADIVSTGDILTAETVASAVMASIVEAGYDLRDVLALLAARDLGACTGGPTAPAFKGLDGTTTRVTGTVDSSGNRSSITLTP